MYIYFVIICLIMYSVHYILYLDFCSVKGIVVFVQIHLSPPRQNAHQSMRLHALVTRGRSRCIGGTINIAWKHGWPRVHDATNKAKRMKVDTKKDVAMPQNYCHNHGRMLCYELLDTFLLRNSRQTHMHSHT